MTITGLDGLRVSDFTITKITYDPCLLNTIVVTVTANIGLSSPGIHIYSAILGNFDITNPHLFVNNVVLTIRINKATLDSTITGFTLGSYKLTGTGPDNVQDLINVLNGFQIDILGILNMYIFSGLNGLDISIPSSELVQTLNPPSASPYESLANLLVTAVNNTLAKLRAEKTPISFFSGCPAGTIDNIPLCGHIDQHGSITYGVDTAICYTPYGICEGACYTAYGLCYAGCLGIPSCTSSCDSIRNGCTNGCTSVRDKCLDALAIKWNLQIKSLLNLGSLHITGVSGLVSVPGPPGSVLVLFNINGTASPQADVTLDVTNLASYNGLVNLGNITFTLRVAMVFNCSTKTVTNIDIRELNVSGVNITFVSPVVNLFVLIRNIFNSQVQSALQGPLRNFLNTQISLVLPLVTPIGCV